MALNYTSKLAMIPFTVDIQKKPIMVCFKLLSIQSISLEGKHRGLQATRHSWSRAAELEKAPSMPMTPR
jgi:hypothetical protein